ncbi:PBECR4 domain-containing protein [Streptococcus danieliae]|uniref:PBECR4 domain-containing protein n=1 Tax=Streptococcus danieliae TaxID=747656 RepID=UPI0021C759B2|nr:PBECR4 domain-containing protein [Streptococcus danieliae]MCU0081784.1 PBECR4 domain-containing protein [Streptococcus danieliae]
MNHQGKSRRERIEYARSRSILDVARDLGMELFRSGKDYRWKEHDSLVINPDKNLWNWFSREGEGGDVIALVESMKKVNFNQAIDFLNDRQFKDFQLTESRQEAFHYYLESYEKPLIEGRQFLKEQRGISDETIDFFLKQGVLSQANAKLDAFWDEPTKRLGGQSLPEPVIVFKSLSSSKELVGASLQGIEENWDKWSKHGYAKVILKNSDSLTGFHVDIGQPQRLVFAESPIDLMSYYQLKREDLADVRLVSMNGLKESTISYHIAQLEAELSGRPLHWTKKELEKALDAALARGYFADGKNQDKITLAVDNDEAGRNFIGSLERKGVSVSVDLPPILEEGQLKSDWNDVLKKQSSKQGDLFQDVDIQSEVDAYIASITQEDSAYYLWQDEELLDLGADGAILEDFHSLLENQRYQVDGVPLYVEESANDGATGYLSLDGSVLDRDGIREYLAEQDFSEQRSVEFLTKLEDQLPEIWEEVLEHYNQAAEKIMEKYKLGEQQEPPISQVKTYEEVKQENEQLVKRLEKRIKSGELMISFDTDVYLYDVFKKLGNSYPTKYVNDKRFEILAPLRPILASIDDETVNLYKEKGTVEQDSLYQALKPHQPALSVDISTRFIGELAIAAYNTNRQIESLSGDHFGHYYGAQTLDSLSQSIERMLEYPLIEAEIRDYKYGFVTTRNAFYHYLDEQEGDLVLSRSDLDLLRARIEEQPLRVVDDIREEGLAASKTQEKAFEVNQKAGQVLAPEVIKMDSARYSIYQDYSVFLKKGVVYLGKHDNYQGSQGYDNRDQSLIWVSDNKNMWSLLSEDGWVYPVETMVKMGTFTESDIQEFEDLKSGLLKDLTLTPITNYSVHIQNNSSHPDFTREKIGGTYLTLNPDNDEWGLVPYQDFMTKLYEVNQSLLASGTEEEFSIEFSILGNYPHENINLNNIHYEIGRENQSLGERLNWKLEQPTLYQLDQEVFNGVKDQIQAHQEKVGELIQDIVSLDKNAFYLEHDSKLYDRGASSDEIEVFHGLVPTIANKDDLFTVSLENSSEVGVSGFLALNGDPIDETKIYDHLDKLSLQPEQQLRFLEDLKTAVSSTWNEAVTTYDKAFDEVVAMYSLEKTSKDYFVRFEFSEHDFNYQEGEIIPYETFARELYSKYHFSPQGYYKTYFEVLDANQESISGQMRIDIGSDWESIGFYLSEDNPHKSALLEKDEFVMKNLDEEIKVAEQKEKSPEKTQEIMDDRASVGEGSLQLEAEGSTKPVAETATFEQTVTSHPTSPYPYLHFNTNFEPVQRRKSKYHPINPEDLKRMNQYSPSIQRTAQWYLDELSGSHIHYFYSDKGEMNILDVSFKQENFLHLTGIRPIDSVKQASDFVVDFAQGYGNYNQMLVSNNLKDKLQVLPMLEDILDPTSFVLDNLEEVRTAKRLNLSEAIKSKDEDFLLLFKDIGDELVPASLMKIKGEIKVDLDNTDEKIILGVFRNRDGIIEQLSINEEYVKDGGQEMLSILQNKQYEESTDVDKNQEQIVSLSAEEFTPVLDTAYNLGDLRNLGIEPLEKFQAAWERYYELSNAHEGDFTAVVEAADQLGLVNKESAFYREWSQDRIYEESYHVQIQWFERWPDSPQLPFNEIDRVDYQSFAEVLYEQNKAFYERNKESAEIANKTENQDAYIPYTNIKFDVYAPGGKLIKEGVRYNIGDEIEPISRLLGMGYRRLEGYEALAKMDEEIFNQLENRVTVAENDSLVEEESYALRRSRAKLERLKKERDEAIDAAMDHQKLTNGQPMNDKRGGQSFLKKQGQKEDKVFALLDEIKKQEEKVASLEDKERWKKQGLNRRGTGLDISVENIPLIEAEIAKADKGEGSYSPQTIKRYKAELVKLKAMQEKMDNVTIHPKVQELIDAGKLSQWKKQPTIYFVKGLRKVAVELTDDGQLQLPSSGKFHPKTAEDKDAVQELLTLVSQEKEESIQDTSEVTVKEENQSEIVSVEEGELPLSTEKVDYSQISAQELSEVAFQKIREFSRDPEALKEYLDFMSRFPQLSPRNAALIQAQWPGANAVATYKQWQGMGESLGITPEDVIGTKAIYKNKKTGEVNEVIYRNLSVKVGEKAQITLFRPIMVDMIPVLDEQGRQLKNDKGNPQYKKLSQATPQEKALIKEGKLPVRQFQQRDPETGYPRYTTYKVFELSQTTLKPEAYPKAMPNRHYDFNLDQVRTKEVLSGLCDYSKKIGVPIVEDDAQILGNAKGGFDRDSQIILLNNRNTPGEMIGTTIHELAHATLHNPKFTDLYRESIGMVQMELEAEMTSYLVSNHFGLDTSEKSISYMAIWTKNLSSLTDQELTQSMKRIHQTTARIVHPNYS